MFYQPLMNEEEKALQQEVRKFVRDEVSHDFIRALDRDEIQYPREYVENLAAHNLLGLRFDPKWGGRGLPWTSEVIAEEEIGVLGNTLGCAFVMPSIVGEALHVFGSEEQKERFLKPILQGKMISAEALTEPRGGSDFFGATSRAEDKGDHFVVNGQKRFVVGATEADVFLVYCRTNFDDNSHKYQRISAIMVERGPGVEAEYQYGLLGTRGGGTGRLVFRNVKVPKENLIGELNKGWGIAKYLLTHERQMIGGFGLLRAGGESLGQTALGAIGENQGRLADDGLRADITAFEVDELGFALTVERVIDEAKAGQGTGAASSMLKYYGTELNKIRNELLMSVGGSEALAWGGQDDLTLAKQWLRTKGNSIEGGTSEVQLNIIAKRILGLPS